MAIQISGTDVIDNNKKGIFKSFNPGQYTTANLPSNAEAGDIVYNTDENKLSTWTGTAWKTL